MGVVGRQLLRSAVTLVIGVVAFAILIVVLLSWWEADKIVHPQRRPIARTPAEFGESYEEVAFETEDGILIRGWWLPPDAPTAPAVIVQAGHDTNRVNVITHTVIIAGHGYGVLSFDWRATGESGGDVSTVGLTEARDVTAALDWLATRTDVDQDRIGAVGQSAGAAAIIHAAADDPRIAAVVAETTFARLEDMVNTGIESRTGLPPFPFANLIAFFGQTMAGMSLDDNRPVDKIGALAPRPILIIRGGADTWAPSFTADMLYAAAGKPKELWDVPGAAHSKVYLADPAGYEERVPAFLNAALQGDGGAP